MAKHGDYEIWSGVSDDQWKDWKWQVAHSIESVDALRQVVPLSDDEALGAQEAARHMRIRVSPHIALMMAEGDGRDTLRKQFVPTREEVESEGDSLLFPDVNDDDGYSPVPGLVHRYPTKVLVFPSNFCGCFCRYCFRRKLKRDCEDTLAKQDYDAIVDYIRDHPQINEVIFSGGDPLVVDDDMFEYFLGELADVETVKIVRFHTRMVITVPYRITDDFVSMLGRFKRRFAIYMVMHVDTIREFSPEAKEAVDKLVDQGIPCMASCPLLRGVNDDEATLAELWNGLVENRVKPYYLFHSDPVQGLAHFLVPLERGMEITRNLYDRVSGLAMPLYCFNVPEGGGHVLISYPYVNHIGGGVYELTNFEGKKTTYKEPAWGKDQVSFHEED